eukprot:220226-Amphidinium_carterae.1
MSYLAILHCGLLMSACTSRWKTWELISMHIPPENRRSERTITELERNGVRVRARRQKDIISNPARNPFARVCSSPCACSVPLARLPRNIGRSTMPNASRTTWTKELPYCKSLESHKG